MLFKPAHQTVPLDNCWEFSLSFAEPKHGSLGSNCQSNADCTTANTQCTAQKCSCAAGFETRDQDFTCSEYWTGTRCWSQSNGFHELFCLRNVLVFVFSCRVYTSLLCNCARKIHGNDDNCYMCHTLRASLSGTLLQSWRKGVVNQCLEFACATATARSTHAGGKARSIEMTTPEPKIDYHLCCFWALWFSFISPNV